MIYRVFLTVIALTSTTFGQAPNPERGGERKKDPAFAPIEDVVGLPRVLLIGDSISVGYTLPTRKALEGVANVHRIPFNGSDTGVALQNIEPWLASTGSGKKWDVIHFNWGLHDLKHWKDNKLDLAGPPGNPAPTIRKKPQRNHRQAQGNRRKTHLRHHHTRARGKRRSHCQRRTRLQ